MTEIRRKEEKAIEEEKNFKSNVFNPCHYISVLLICLK